ncbi:MAG: hypothetical protein HYR72_17540 [Deltaproteobacteria bacterium]|nr:hypothetical protein [Deltaproteobacteria bacterium]MBI3386475.1 hypothetical protein [Deltaproteobacteria bacterium]
MGGQETVICLYRVRKGNERKFVKLLQRHWPTLRRFGLVTAARPKHFRGVEQGGRAYPIFVEIFDWKNARAAQMAHEHPEVMAIWEPMDKLCEARDGRPNMEFPHVRPLKIRVQA